MGEENEKGAKWSSGFKRAEEENRIETSKESNNKNWSSNTHERNRSTG